MTTRDILIALSIKYHGDWNAIYNAIETHEELNDALSYLKSNNSNAITIIDSDYPSYLKQVVKPPFVLFYKGDISLLNGYNNHLGVVGSRKASQKFKDKTKEIIFNLNKDIVIVSGLASGIDGVSHKAAIDSGKKTIAVIGSGLNYSFPSENEPLYNKIKKNHLILTEYPDAVPPNQENFPKRNRIIAALSKIIFIPEAKRRSGSVITAGVALQMGKEILCLPSENFGDSACNVFLKEGGILVENADDVAYYLG